MGRASVSGRLKLLWAAFSLVVGVALTQENECRLQTKCDLCIQTTECQWCSEFKEEVTDDRAAHCFHISNSTAAAQCAAGHLENPQNSQVILENADLSSTDRKTRQKEDMIVQLKPQRMRLSLRKAATERVSLTYKQAAGYPIDLYYLMDLSNSMADDKRQLAVLGRKLTQTLQNLTEFYTIGFGSFVDKVLLPFVDTHPDKIDSPCTGCAKAFSFRNDLPLGPDGDSFSRKVNDARISGNLDSPEGGFDALMQVIVCKDEIKWRDQARRLIVFSTDAKFHHAGDGKLTGIVVPNDEKCHLNAVGEYDAYHLYDYPSIGQINKMSKEKDIYIIFAVSNYADIYEKLTEIVENSSFGKLSSDSSNVVDLVRDQYNKITSVISLTDNSTDAISIEYKSNCKDSSATPVVTQECNNMREGDEVTFTLDVKLNDCPADREREIVEVKTLQDSFFVEIDFKCNCVCQTTDNTTIPEAVCNDQGALVCGVCSCFPGFRGERCHCSADGTGDDGKDEDLCKANADDEELCSGKGLCNCGSCECDKDYSGTFCHCNNRMCLSDTGEECSGRGICNCGKCSCNSGYTGRVCECKTEAACRRPGDQDICSGHGTCDCGQCQCNAAQEDSYSGQFCEDCLTCIGKCSEFHEGVLCRFHNPTSSACNLTTLAVGSLQDEEALGARLCWFIDGEDGCKIYFTYRYKDDTRSYVIHVLREKECPEPAPIMGIIFGILAGIVAIGLLTLLLWKLLTTMHDRREYAKFEEDRRNAKWNAEGNPLYKDPTNTFVNPAFSQQQALTE